jgi:hypothetical protein
MNKPAPDRGGEIPDRQLWANEGEKDQANEDK